MKRDFSNSRLYFLFVFFIILGTIVIGRLFFLQIKEHSKYRKMADAQHIREEVIYAKRGKIFFSDGINILADNQGVSNVAVAPREVENEQEVAKTLSSALGISEDEILKKIKNKDISWVIIKNNVPLSKTEKIDILPGIHFEPHLSRFYPQGDIASSVVGFYGYDSKGEKKTGCYGIEEYYQKQLAGIDGFRRGMVDAEQNPIFSSQNKIKEAVNGSDIVLTIDQNIQFFIEEKVKEAYKKYKPKNITFIVMSPKTGEILAMASLPNFDPNKYYKEKNSEVFKNPALLSFEPGSIFKPITAAAGIEEGVITPQTTYVDKGAVKIGGFTIKNSDLKAHGKRTMTQVIEFSLNTGVVFIQQRLGRTKFVNYVKKFGFGKKTGIDLFGEELGNIENIVHPRSNEKLIECANASFGQGISVTPMQILTAFTAIANQGKMVKPYIVKEIRSPDGKIKKTKRKVLGQPISAETASRVSAMMVSTVKNGYSKKADVKGYLIAAKTGTAQASWSYFGIKKVGYSGKTVQSFINFAPAFDPKFLILLKMDAPTSGPRFSSDSLAPIAKEINTYLFGYMGIPPE